MRDLAMFALDTAKNQGATYADIRIVQTKSEDINTKNGAIGSLDESENIGFGIRVIAKGAWGFAASDNLKKESFERTAALAVKIARASAKTKSKNIRLAPAKAVVDTWQTPFIKDPFKISLEKKLELLFKIDESLRKVKGVTIANGWMNFKKREKIFASTEGSFIEQTLVQSGVGYSATASGQSDSQTRSFPSSWGQFATKGYELVEELPLLENTQRVAEESVSLLKAPQAPAGEFDILIDGNHVALQIHESCGHPSELDRVLGEEAGFMGTSFLTIDKLNKLKYGSEKVTITADATSPGGLATYGYDDEGVPAQKWDLVRNGLFVGYLTSRETALSIGEEFSRGAMRADGWNRIPLIRIINISLEPGEWRLQDLIEDTKEGFYFDTTKSWSIDQQRLNFQFACELAWEIKNGKKTRMLKNPVYQGITPVFWNSCDAICNKDNWVIWGIPSCGKGEPGQLMEVAHGASTARFRKVKCGAGYGK